MRLLLLIAVPLVLYFVVSAKAQDMLGDPAKTAGRYTMHPSGDQFLRLDTQTGDVSVCERRLERWICEEVADAAEAKDEEIARLSKELADLRARIAALRAQVPEAGEPGTGADGKIELPTKEDLDKVMTFFEDVMQRFNDMVKRLDQQMQGEPEKQKI